MLLFSFKPLPFYPSPNMLATWPPTAQPIFQDPNMVRQMSIASLSACQALGFILCNQEIGFLKGWTTWCNSVGPTLEQTLVKVAQFFLP